MKLTTSARRWTAACATFFFLFLQSPGAQHIAWTPEARSAHALITALRVDEGLTAIRLQRIQQPDNLIWTYLEDYGEFLSIFIREDLRRIPAYREASASRLEKLETLSETEPLALMAQAQLSLHQCALQLQESQFIAAGTSINKAFKLLKRNHRLHPGDAGTLRLYAALKAAFGAIPDQYRWLVAMLTSLTGSIEEGLRELHGLLENTRPADNPFYKETVLFTALIEGKLNDRPEEAARLIVQHYGQSPPDKAVQFTLAHILMAAGQNDGAIRTLEANLPGTPVPFMDFMLGQCKLYRGDKDADIPFQHFLRQHTGKHFIKEAYQKLAWHALLRDDRAGYVRNMQQVLIRGSATTDEDKQALREAEYHQTPHPVLLRARLAFDGGYHGKALDLLTDELYKTLGQHLHRLEFLYRKGRIFQARRQFAEALHYFHLAINMGRYDTAYYACSAALQCGLIHERLGHKAEAATYYDMCLEFAPETYASGLHQEARIGLNRIGY